MTNKFRERRRHTRIPMVCVIQARIGESAESDPCMLVDVSAGGARILSQFPISAGDEIILTIPLSEDEIIDVPGCIMWTREMGLMKEYHFGVEYMAGVKFFEINEMIKKHIQIFMGKQQ